MNRLVFAYRKALIGVAIAAGVVVTGCGGATPHYAITPTQALAVFNVYNHNNQKANATLNTALQNQQETSTAAEIDDANYQAYHYLCTSTETPAPRRLTVCPGHLTD